MQRSNLWSMVSLTTAVSIGACGDSRQTSLEPGDPGSVATTEVRSTYQTTESAKWNAVSRDLSQKYKPPQHVGMRGLAYLSLAQYDAVVTAEIDASRPSPRAAAAGASVAVLSWLYPLEAGFLESLIETPKEGVARFSAGLLIGRTIGAAVVASAGKDKFNLVWTGTVPVGPGLWFSSVPPIGPRLGEMRPFFLTSGSQFRPGPPPAFGSAEYLEALAVVRHFSDTRTPDQDALAKFWAAPNGFALIPAYHNTVANDLITKYRLSERAAAHTFALANQAAMDGFIACHDAKYTYWLLRPTMADPLITLSVPLPNHPSYPSNHACVTGSFMNVLGRLFPEEAGRLAHLADQAAYSRIVGGLHYPFDGSTGLAIGRQIGPWALEHDVTGNQLFAIK